MELIRISKRKLKIMLTPTDMRHFELNANSFGEDCAQTQRAFHLLLEEIKKQTDFDADDKSIAVQYFPSREGGCEMFISRLPSAEEHVQIPRASEEELKPLPMRPLCRAAGFHKECAYRFEKLSSLLSVCRRLCEIGYIGSNSAFCDDQGYYYLFLNILASSPFTIPNEFGFIVEYGMIENHTQLKLYLREHGKAICEENAIHLLAPLA